MPIFKRYKGANSRKIALSTFAEIGLIFMVVGTVVCSNAFTYRDKVETIAIITDFESYRERVNGRTETHYKTHITYDAEGRSYTNVVNMYSSSRNVGDEIGIYYHTDDPYNGGSKGTDVALLAIPCVGLVFLPWARSRYRWIVKNK